MEKILFSVNTVLAYRIAKTYFKNVHFVWCAGKYEYDNTQPASSNPIKVVQRYFEDVVSQDEHSALIRQNREGIIRGAMEKRRAGVITEDEEKLIVAMVKRASFDSFLPLLYVIPSNSVSDICAEVPISKKASPPSVEYLIEELPRESFEIINISKTVLSLGGAVL